jgi:ADP-heptose:LPS heptosyltransferase
MDNTAEILKGGAEILEVTNDSLADQKPYDYAGKKVLFWRGGTGLGDMVQCTPLFSRLKKAGVAQLDAFVWPTTKAVIENNPHVDNIYMFPEKLTPGNDTSAEEKNELFAKFQAEQAEKYDVILSMSWTVEGSFLFKTTFHGKYAHYKTLKKAQDNGRGVNWFEHMAKIARLPAVPGDRYLPEFYFSDQEEADYKAFMKQKGHMRYVLWNPTGSSNNKVFRGIFPIIQHCADRWKNTIHVVVGRYSTEIQHERILTVQEKWPLRRIFNFMRGFDLAVGCESVVMNASGAYNIPKIIYYTHCWPESIGKNFTNHQSVVPQFNEEEEKQGLACYPCYWIPVDYKGIFDDYRTHYNALCAYRHCMEFHPQDMYRPIGYRCVNRLDPNDMMQKIASVLDRAKIGKKKKGKRK